MAKSDLTRQEEGGATNAQPYMLESDEFREFVEKKRAIAATVKDNLLTEIARLEVEMRQRLGRVADQDEIIHAADRALNGMKRPELTKPKIVNGEGGVSTAPLET